MIKLISTINLTNTVNYGASSVCFDLATAGEEPISPDTL